ncbi:MAG: lysoplasmalogenase [Phycicoccus sp.]|nr:lysoplasmalogenase [Phycicoccus sp.]
MPFPQIIAVAVPVVAVAQVVAVALHREKLAARLKLVPMLGLIAVLAPELAGFPAGQWFLAGLVLCMVGDALLIRHSATAFLMGLGAFLVGHVLYVLAFVAGPSVSSPWQVVAPLALLPLAGVGIARVVPGARRQGGWALAGPVVAYLVVIGAMVVAAGSTGRALLVLGAVLFAVSDLVLGLNRFVRPLRWGPTAVMSTYYLAQFLLAGGMLAAAPS